ncbi:TPA: hypothetical protein N0F65_005283 [Lagenidium giganteum]|uniref:N-acetylgalactosaminide beta-1,3-galactosyltransferase n=1 Tax=Lagenidium giganteum TaxID=4803 RepID=A0AAV2Z1N0_9STRA|nr:TPA: hypothetical protein N0F65_005283 [Lagenidium giganteum]
MRHPLRVAVVALVALLQLSSDIGVAIAEPNAIADANAALASKEPGPAFDKAELCAADVDMSQNALKLIQVTPAPRPKASEDASRYPRIFCFVNTISVHRAKAQAVADTWGQRCNKLVFFSNETSTIVVGEGTPNRRTFDVVAMDVPADHNHLWQKHKVTLEYVYEHYRHDYDWFYKADDDAYVIVENLREYLQRPEVLMNYQVQPMQMGHRFNLTQELVSYYIVDDALEDAWRAKWNRWVFNSGGPGYVMNRLYMDQIVKILPDWRCLSDDYSEMLPDDASISFCMMWYDVYPWDSRDYKGRERWHADKPRGVYFTNPDQPEYWYVQYHNMIGGVRWKEESCAPDSIAFHYISPPLMYHLERQLYWCRQHDLPDIAAFNNKYDLTISDRVHVWEDVPPPKDYY